MANEHGGVPAPSSGGGAPQRFGEREVADILRRAADAETRPDLPAPHDPTLGDLMEAARQVGLDPAEVRRAAAVRPQGPRGATGALLGAPDHREVRATLDGAALPSHPATAAAIEGALGRSGEVTAHDADGLTWQEQHVGGRTRVEARRSADRGDGTTLEVRATAQRAGHYLATWFVALVAWAAASALTPLGILPLAAKILGFLAGPVVVARPFWVRADRRLRRRLEQTVLAVLREAEAPRAPGGPEGKATGDEGG